MNKVGYNGEDGCIIIKRERERVTERENDIKRERMI